MATNRQGSQTEIKKPSKQKSSENRDNCRDCGERVSDSHKGIECEVCRCWFHAACEELKDEEYIVLTRHTKARIHWYCKTCNEGSLEMLQMVRSLQNKISRVESDIDTLGKNNRGRMTQNECQMDKMNTEAEVDRDL